MSLVHVPDNSTEQKLHSWTEYLWTVDGHSNLKQKWELSFWRIFCAWEREKQENNFTVPSFLTEDDPLK